MKNILKKIISKNLLVLYYKLRKKIRIIPKDEKVKFDSSTISDGHLKVTYRGVSACRCPFDYCIYQMILFKIKPDLVIEIGTSHGGGALYIADLMNIIGHGIVHSIDIEKKTEDLVTAHPRIKLFTEGWEKYDISDAKQFSKVLIIEDASHMYEGTLGALQKFSTLVSLESYFIVEDGIVSDLGRDKGFHGGPLKAIREFMTSNNDFEVDRSYCDMFGKNATFNVNGYLKRIR